MLLTIKQDKQISNVNKSNLRFLSQKKDRYRAILIKKIWKNLLRSYIDTLLEFSQADPFVKKITPHLVTKSLIQI